MTTAHVGHDFPEPGPQQCLSEGLNCRKCRPRRLQGASIGPSDTWGQQGKASEPQEANSTGQLCQA